MAIMLDVILRVALVLATGFLSGIILLAYLRVKSTKLLLFLIGFSIFFIHALLYMPTIMISNYKIEFTENLHIAFNLFAMIFITLGILKEEK
jgi:hypothetical protein